MLGDIYDDLLNSSGELVAIGQASAAGDPYGGYGDEGDYSGGSNIWDQLALLGVGLGSQAIQAWGNHPTQQVGAAGTVGIGGGYSPSNVLQSAGGIRTGVTQQYPVGTVIGTQGQGVAEDALGSLSRFVTQHSGMVMIGAVALFLLYRQPPSRR